MQSFKGCKHSHGHLLEMDGPCHGAGVWIQLPSLVGTHFCGCRFLGCTWSLAWLYQSSGCKCVSSPSVSDFLGCKSATCLMEEGSTVFYRVVLVTGQWFFFSVSYAFIFAPFVESQAIACNFSTYTAFNCESNLICWSFSLPLEKLLAFKTSVQQFVEKLCMNDKLLLISLVCSFVCLVSPCHENSSFIWVFFPYQCWAIKLIQSPEISLLWWG